MDEDMISRYRAFSQTQQKREIIVHREGTPKAVGSFEPTPDPEGMREIIRDLFGTGEYTWSLREGGKMKAKGRLVISP